MNRSVLRKVSYLVAMGLLLIPLSVLSLPETSGGPGEAASAGGKMAQLRAKHSLSQARLGQIDPTSETLKLATLGMRGVAANILWKKATDYQRTEDWTNLSATLEQISRLQPNFISVWRFQGWNLSYNVSVEWDDYRQRYAWVVKGVNFLKEGMRYNEREPLLPWDVGWVIGHKMGTADEKKQHRLLFRADDDYHGTRPIEMRDNWLVGKDSFIDALNVVRNRGASTRGVSPVIFFSGPAKWQTNYAAALEVDGGSDGKAVFGERARLAWDKAAREWEEFGTTPVPSTQGVPIQLGELSTQEKRAKELADKLAAVEPGLKDKIIAEKRAKLSAAERTALEVPADKRTPEQVGIAAQAEGKLQITHQELADRVEGPQRSEAQKLAQDAIKADGVVRSINSSREIIQYVYWKTRCEAERLDAAIKARELMYKGNQAYLVDTDLEAARTHYEDCFVEWRKVLDAYPSLASDRVIGDDLVGPSYLPGAIRYYEAVLKKLDEKFPPLDKFILKDVIELVQPDPPIGQ